MAEFPSLPLWTDAYLADTRHLSTVEHGAYLLLLMEAWRRPSCSLPDDDRLLARLSGLSDDEWLKIKGIVLDFWQYDGRRKEWRQLRLVKERDFLSSQSASQRDRVLKRWNKRENTHTGSIPDLYPADTQPIPPHPHPYNTSSLRSEDIKEKPKKSDGMKEFKSVLSGVMREDILRDFCSHRKAKKAAFTETAAKMFLKAASDCGMSPDKAAVTAIDRNWITVKPEWLGRENRKATTIAGAAAQAIEENRNEQFSFDPMERQQGQSDGRIEPDRPNVRLALPKLPK